MPAVRERLPEVDIRQAPGRVAALRRRRLRRGPGAAGRPLHDGPRRGRGGDGPGDAAGRRGRGLRVGPRRRSWSAVDLLGRGGGGRPGRSGRELADGVDRGAAGGAPGYRAAWTTWWGARSPRPGHTPRSRTGGSRTRWASVRRETTCARSTTPPVTGSSRPAALGCRRGRSSSRRPRGLLVAGCRHDHGDACAGLLRRRDRDPGVLPRRAAVAVRSATRAAAARRTSG